MKPRCQGHHDGGAHTSFLCVLDEGHDGFCKPYVPPDVDEWRSLQFLLTSAEEDARFYAGRTVRIEEACRADVARLQAENDALRAIIESGAGAAKDAVGLLAKVIRGDYQWPNGVAWAVRETHRILTGGPPDGVYVRAKEDAEVAAGVQAGRDDLRGLAGKAST